MCVGMPSESRFYSYFNIICDRIKNFNGYQFFEFLRRGILYTEQWRISLKAHKAPAWSGKFSEAGTER